jgi:hypothetical protein
MPEQETWTCARLARGNKAAKVHVWYDAERVRSAFTMGKGRRQHYTVGGTYQVQCERDSGGTLSRPGEVIWRGRVYCVEVGLF